MTSIRYVFFFLGFKGFQWRMSRIHSETPQMLPNKIFNAATAISISRILHWRKCGLDQTHPWSRKRFELDYMPSRPLKNWQAAAVTQSHLHERRTRVMIHYGSVNADTSHARTETFLSVCRLITTSSRIRQDNGGRRFPCQTQNCLNVLLKKLNLLHLPKAKTRFLYFLGKLPLLNLPL